MATILNIEGCRFVVFSHDHRHPPHVHVFAGDCVSKWEFDPLRCVEFSGCSKADRRKIERLIVERFVEIKARWQEEWERRDGLA